MMAKKYLKQFTESVTGSKDKIFLWAQLKLTFFYLIIIISILFVSSLSLYVSLAKNTKETYTEKIKNHVLRQEAIQSTSNKLKDDLILGNIVLVIFSGGLAFFLASKNLGPIKKILEKQKRFNADASHDLRTPLAIMKTDCEVNLRRKDVSVEEFRELAKSNLEEINRMSAMVDQLLFLSRNNSLPGQQMEPIYLGNLTEKMVESFQGLAKNKKIMLIISEAADGVIKGNMLDLERIFYNILKNAIDYTPAGGKIMVAVQKNDSQLVFSVEDNGTGISSADLPHITEAFYKVDKVRGEESGGSGLGLSIVEEIVKNHWGVLNIKSEINRGTKVNIFFPLI